MSSIELRVTTTPILKDFNNTSTLSCRVPFSAMIDDNYKSDRLLSTESSRGSSTKLGLFADGMNVLKSFIGSNYLVMPYAYAQGGLVLGSVALIFIAVLTDHCCSILVKCKKRAESDISARTNGKVSAVSFTYGDVAREAYGDVAYNIVDMALTFTQFGFCIQYFIFVVTALRSFTSGIPLYVLALVPISFLIPCAFLPSVQSLSPVSGVANLAILCGFVGILSYDFKTGKDLFNMKDVPLCNWEQFPIFFSICMSCFEGIGTVLPVESSMASGRKNYPFMLHTAITFTTGFLGSFGIMGLLRFGKNGVDQIATENLPADSHLTTGITAALIFAILFTFPLQMFPVIQCTEKWFLIPKEHPLRNPSMASLDSDFYGETRPDSVDKLPYNPIQSDLAAYSGGTAFEGPPGSANIVTLSALSAWLFRLTGAELREDGKSFDALEVYGPVAGICLWKTFLLRTCLILFASLVGLLAVNDFSYIASLVGALGATALSFIIPSILHMKFFKGEITFWEKVSDVTIAFIGVVAALTGLYTTIKDWVG